MKNSSGKMENSGNMDKKLSINNLPDLSGELQIPCQHLEFCNTKSDSIYPVVILNEKITS